MLTELLSKYELFYKVTIAGAQLLASTFRNLTHLAVTGSGSMDARSLAPLITDLVDLRHIDLTG